MSTNISLVNSFGAEFLNFVAVVASCMLHLILICLMASMLFVVCCQVFSLKRIYLHRDIYRLTWFYTYATCKRINDILLMLRLFPFFLHLNCLQFVAACATTATTLPTAFTDLVLQYFLFSRSTYSFVSRHVSLGGCRLFCTKIQRSYQAMKLQYT